MTALVAALRAAIGSAQVLTDGVDIETYRRDGRGTVGGAFALARPASAVEVAAVVAIAHRHATPLVVQGARTGLVAAGIARDDDHTLLLSLDRLAGEPLLDRVNRTAEVKAGTRLSELNRAAAAHNLFFPIDLGADPSIGGMIAANTGGARLLRYGDVRRNLLGLEIVTAEPQPRILKLGAGLWKDNSGLDLKQMLIGSAGSLGIVTTATVALSPRPANRLTAMLALDRPETATELLLALEDSFGTLLSAFEGMSQAALAAALKHVSRLRAPFANTLPTYAVLVELAAGPAIDIELLEEKLAMVLQPWLDTGAVLDAATDRRDGLWAIRHAIPEGLRAAGTVVACDIALRRGDVMRFRSDLVERLRMIAPQLMLYDFGHVGDGGLHFNLVWPNTAGAVDMAQVRAARALVFCAAVEDYGGSFSAEHGIGPANAEWYARLVPEPVRALAGAMQRLFAPVPIGRVDFAGPNQE
jgi:FAD/FMN-containing dehydrogenase